MTSIHDGHRKRLRERFRTSGITGFAPHEALELLLTYAKPRGDVNPLAHELLNTFGSLHGVLEAGPDQLMQVKGVGEETATLLSLMVPMLRLYQESKLTQQDTILNYRDSIEYCMALLSGLRSERFCAVLLGVGRQVLGTRVIAEGSLNEVPAYPRKVVEAVLNLNAHSVILCHNHPGNTPEPSAADIESTKLIGQALKGIDVQLLDHVIVAGVEGYSMTCHGHMMHQ